MIDEAHEGGDPYEEMPKLNIFTYRMGDIVMAKVREGVEIDGDTEAYAFDLNEFFVLIGASLYTMRLLTNGWMRCRGSHVILFLRPNCLMNCVTRFGC